MLSAGSILFLIPALLVVLPAYGFSPSIIRSSCITNTAKNFHVGVTASSISSSALFSSEESPEGYESEFNLDEDDSTATLIPAAGIAILGFIFSIVVAFNARDELVSEFNKVKVPKMEYTPTVVEEGKCRGLCSSQEEDVDSLRNFMEGISKKSSNY